MEKVIRNDKVAVLYSPGYGAGWYTCNTKYPACIFHPKIVELVEQGKRDEITSELCEELFCSDKEPKDGYFYTGGACDLQIEWIEEGTEFEITEYDGFESISLKEEPDRWITA